MYRAGRLSPLPGEIDGRLAGGGSVMPWAGCVISRRAAKTKPAPSVLWDDGPDVPFGDVRPICRMPLLRRTFPPGRDQAAITLQRRRSIMATCPRVASALGDTVLPPVPWMISAFTAQDRACRA